MNTIDSKFTAALLAQSKRISQLSLCFTILTLAVALFNITSQGLLLAILPIFIILLGVAVAYYGLRCSFDEKIFLIAQNQENWQSFDQWCAQYLNKPSDNEKGIEQRIKGALKLLKMQAIMFALQLLFLLLYLALKLIN